MIKKRYLAVVVFALACLALILGVAVPVGRVQAKAISTPLSTSVKKEAANGSLVGSIFLNNFAICLFMFIPVVGFAAGYPIIFDTGRAVQAIALTQNQFAWSDLGRVVCTPVFWLEFAAYTVAMTESVWLTSKLFKEKKWSELKGAVPLVALCAVLLLVSAVIEAYIIVH